MTAAPLPRIAVLALGGTIGSPVARSGGGSALTDGAEALVAAIPELAGLARIEPSTFRTAMSADLSFADIADLARHIDDLAESGVEGAVVTQGTDTLEESAYLLDLLVGDRIPVVVTGAMRNPGLLGADGPANLVAAVRVALSEQAAGAGVLVVLDSVIHAARWVRKTHATALGAFSSAPLGPLGYVVEDRVRVALRPTARPGPIRIASGTVPRVALVTLSLDDDPSILEALPALGYRGAVVQAFGAGHAGRRSLAALTALAAAMPTVFSSRVGSGELYRATGGYPGSETDLLARGLIGSAALDGLRSRVLLAALLAAGVDDRSTLRAAFDTA